MVLSSNPKSKTIKAGTQFNGYVSNFTHNQKIQKENNFCVFLNKKLLHFQSQGV